MDYKEQAKLNVVQDHIKQMNSETIGKVSDGYHTFDELYEFRLIYNALLFNRWADGWYKKEEAKAKGFMTTANCPRLEYSVHKSKNHHDGSPCFDGNWFIVVAKLPEGLVSNHYHMKDWDKFKIPEYEKARFEHDGHTGKDVLLRFTSLL